MTTMLQKTLQTLETLFANKETAMAYLAVQHFKTMIHRFVINLQRVNNQVRKVRERQKNLTERD